MSEFRPMTECKGFNMERVLLKNKNGYMITAYFKDGMLQCDGDEEWTQPIAWKGFIRLQDLANGVATKDSGLHLQRVVFSGACKCEKPDPFKQMPYKCFRCHGKIEVSEVEVCLHPKDRQEYDVENHLICGICKDYV